MNATEETIKTYKYALKHFVSFMEDRGRTTYSEITRMDIVAFVEHARSSYDTDVWSKSRYALVIKTLKVMFRWIGKDDDCRDEGLKSWCDRMPKGVAVPKRETIPSSVDLVRWQKAFNTRTVTGLRDYILFSVLMETGMRRGELVSIKVEHLQFDSGMIWIPKGKEGSRTVTMTKSLADRLKMYLKKREKSYMAGSPYLFPSRRSLEEPTNAQYISQIFRAMIRKHKLPRITPHFLRHSFCTQYLVRGGGIEGMRVESGHKTYSSLLHYLHLAKVGNAEHKAETERVSAIAALSTR